MNREFTDEGKLLSDNLTKYDELVNNGITDEEDSGGNIPPRKTKRERELEREIDGLKMEITKMIVNSQMVVQDCSTILEDVKTMEDYMKCDAKAVKGVHQRLIVRLGRILAGKQAFEDESHLTVSIDKIKAHIASRRKV